MTLFADNALCHICKLPVNTAIVCSDHPLFPTTDHVIPKSKGGTSERRNLKPAHRFCNIVKGNLLPIPPELREQCRLAVRSFYRESPSLLPEGRKARQLLGKAGVRFSPAVKPLRSIGGAAS